ncbi:hypothetical protein Csa_003583 [Cucumis sativus]|uniref:Transmembrane protein n=1 Tax=Cucumis sativus TaxID=3659 RepID=A0A0A0KFW2_CUCSA|nr:hypothetical protein Csa_003583 [Cucumis sativus]
MDEVKLENLKFVGIFGILHETFKLISQWRKIFTQITLLFILPLSLLIFANNEVSKFFLQKISQEKTILQQTQESTPQFLKLSHLISSQNLYYSLFNFAFLIFSPIFSLLSTSATVYTVACIYAARDISFTLVMAVLPKLWKQLLITFLCYLASIFAFTFVAIGVLCLIPLIAILIYGLNTGQDFILGNKIIFFFFIISYCIGIWYFTTIWQLSSVVSVLEKSCGFKALEKSKNLLKGKMKMVIKLWVLLDFPLGVIQFALLHYFVTRSTWVGWSILGICWVLSFMVFVLVKLVLETVVYFVCKLHHGEMVDMMPLWNHLQGYVLPHHYDQLKVDDDNNSVQLEKIQAVR